jgi:hypothetical protein
MVIKYTNGERIESKVTKKYPSYMQSRNTRFYYLRRCITKEEPAACSHETLNIIAFRRCIRKKIYQRIYSRKIGIPIPAYYTDFEIRRMGSWAHRSHVIYLFTTQCFQDTSAIKVCLYNMPLLYPNVFECFKLQAILAI